MPIEFRCHQCQRLLRTADNTSGRQTKCPQCGTLLTVPTISTAGAAEGAAPPGGSSAGGPGMPGNLPPAGLPSGFGSSPGGMAGGGMPAGMGSSSAGGNPFAGAANPYASPSAGGYQAAPAGPIQPTVIVVGDVWERSWNIYTNRFGEVFVAFLLYFVISMVISFVGTILNTIFQGIGASIADNGNQGVGATIIIAGLFFTMLLQIVPTVWIVMGYLQYMLNLARGEPANYGQLFSGGRLLLPALGAYVLMSLAIVAGTFLCIVPGLILGIMFAMSLPIIVDQKCGAIESLGRSWNLAKNNFWQMVLLWLMGVGVVLLGYAALCIGVIFAAPLTFTMYIVTYLRMTGRETVRFGNPPAMQMAAPNA